MHVPKWKERRAKSLQAGVISSSMVLTARMFLGKDGSLHYLTPQQLITFNDQGREEDVESFAHVIHLGQQYQMIGCRKSRKADRSGNHYMWPLFNRNGNSDGGKVLNIGNLYQFIDDLYDRKFIIGFTYDDLIEEAEQA